jgi:hypothetical protein
MLAHTKNYLLSLMIKKEKAIPHDKLPRAGGFRSILIVLDGSFDARLSGLAYAMNSVGGAYGTKGPRPLNST